MGIIKNHPDTGATALPWPALDTELRYHEALKLPD
jgi:hypothetical protein